jgi:hypothetical protein
MQLWQSVAAYGDLKLRRTMNETRRLILQVMQELTVG